MQLDVKQLNQLIQDGYIVVQKHPSAELYIYNYTATTQYARNWNDITLNCRGLILDNEYNIVANPFPKFFNLEEHDLTSIPNEPFEVYTKLDGSLGILYWLSGKPQIASRGSFTSQQAQVATTLLYQKYQHLFDKLNQNYTYLFEIIYPENRIVVDYGNLKDIVLLAIRETKTGQDVPLENIGFPLVEKYDGIADIKVIKNLEKYNQEGFVIKFLSGFRVKVKFAEYVRLHKLITQVSNKTIWENLSNNQPWEKLLENVPDEWYEWVKKVVWELEEQYQIIESEAKAVFQVFETRKETAEYYKQQKYPGILFAMLDEKEYSQMIWKMIKPKKYQVFKEDSESL